jgi:hypothetical protein
MVTHASLPGSDWTDDERAQISRLESLCRSIEHWELDCRHTDESDPWCDEHRIMLHIARIDRRYVVVWPQSHRSINIATMETAVDMALAELVSMM